MSLSHLPFTYPGNPNRCRSCGLQWPCRRAEATQSGGRGISGFRVVHYGRVLGAWSFPVTTYHWDAGAA